MKLPLSRTLLPVALLLWATACLKDAPALPETLEWNPEIAFPLGEKSYGLNAVSGFDTSLLELDTITEMPQWVGELQVVMEGTMDFSLASIHENLDRINRMMFRVNLYNGFPNTILAQAYFRDGAGMFIDSMFADGAVSSPPGEVTGNGQTVQPSHTWRDAVFDRSRIQNLDDAVDILLRATLLVEELPDTLLVPYYPSYSLDVRIGAMLDLTVEL